MSYTLHHGDCLDVLKTLPDNSVDLTVTRPPYDNLRAYKGFAFDFEGIARELFRVTKAGGVVVWVVGDAAAGGSETGTSFRQALYFKDVCGFNLADTMIYKKANTGGARGSNRGYWQAFEYMFVLSKGRPKSVSPLIDRPNVRAGKVYKGGGGRLAGGETRAPKKMAPAAFGRRTNIWEYAVGGGGLDHPAPFPEALARDHILSWSSPGDVVLAPFAGSGTTGKMALQNGREFIGIEIAAEYIPIIRARCESALQAAPLFASTP